MTDTYDDIDISEIEAGLKRQEAEWAPAYCAIMKRCCIGCSNVIWNDGNYCWRHGHKIADHMTESCVDFVALFPDDE